MARGIEPGHAAQSSLRTDFSPLICTFMRSYRAHVLVRILLGAMLVYMGLSKAGDPVNFLKLLREYGMLASPVPLNAVAAWLPWFEVVCGVLLIGNIALRGTAMIVVGMFLFFCVAILLRAQEIQSQMNIAFCAVHFDCGCGAGEVNVCRKLLENSLWVVASCWLIISRHSPRKLLPGK
jgi:uncharacterized membrane protein YphA (DoxX/SURF4 family)